MCLENKKNSSVEVSKGVKEIIETEKGDTYFKMNEYKSPETEKGYFFLNDKIDGISETCLRRIAGIFGVEIEEIENYEMVKEISEVALKSVNNYFAVDTNLIKPE